MQPLYEMFTHVTLESVRTFGLILIIVLAGVFVFKLRINKPKKGESNGR